MDKKMTNRLLAVACGGFLTAAIICAGISVFGKGADSRVLFAALGCTVLGNLLNVVRGNLSEASS